METKVNDRSYNLRERNKGHSSAYWVLKLYKGGEVVKVHTSKDVNYLGRISYNWCFPEAAAKSAFHHSRAVKG